MKIRENPRNEFVFISSRRFVRRAIKAECRTSHRQYHSELRRLHVAWSSAVPGRNSPQQAFVAPTLEAALPERWGHLATLIPEAARHRHNRSAGSSQTLALGLLGPAAWGNPNLPWLFEPTGPFPDIGRPVHSQFEYSVGFGLLNEVPRTTDLDFFASGSTGVVALEAKYRRGTRYLLLPGSRRRTMPTAVLDRPYWQIAREVFGLRGPTKGSFCQLGLAY